jgi:hypothetical protein
MRHVNNRADDAPYRPVAAITLIQNMNKQILGLVATLLFVAGCSGQSGNEYLGKWENVKNPKDQVEVVRNGDNFLLKATRANFFTGKVETQSAPATLKDGSLQMQGGMGTVVLAVDHSNGHLVGGGLEYKRPN